MEDQEEKKENIEKIDLLSLPLNERLRMCQQIREALKAKVSEAKIIPSEHGLIADKTLPDPETEPWPEKPTKTDSAQNSTVMNNLLKRLW